MIEVVVAGLLLMQQAATPQEQSGQQSQTEPSKGQVLFERHTPQTTVEDETPAPEQPKQPVLKTHASSSNPEAAAQIEVPAGARRAVRVTGWKLDLHLDLDTGKVETRAMVTLKNVTEQPVSTVYLQISSSLDWEDARQESTRVKLVQQHVDSDADHTGRVSEAAIALAKPLGPDESTTVDAFYSGVLVENGDRMLTLGAGSTETSRLEWDGFNSAQPTSGVRGLGNVIWYPVAEEPVRLNTGPNTGPNTGKDASSDAVVPLVLQARQEHAGDPFSLRLTVESTQELHSAFLNGTREDLKQVQAEMAQNTISMAHLYTAEWKPEKLGDRAPSLFVCVPGATTLEPGLVTAYTDRPDTVVAGYNAAAVKVQPMLQTWLGVKPRGRVQMLDMGGRGAFPFEDGAMVVLPMRISDSNLMAPWMVEWLTHAWFEADETWLNDSVAQWMQELWLERQQRAAGVEDTRLRDAGEAALRKYESATAPVSDKFSSSVAATRPPLTQCVQTACARTKGAAVLRMLRVLVGDTALQAALQAMQQAGHGTAQQMEVLLEKSTGKDLQWFFADWVYADHGLPRISIVNVAPRPIERTVSAAPNVAVPSPEELRARQTGGWMVAVEVRNAGDAAAEVPVTVKAGGSDSTQRLMLPARSVRTVRMLVPSKPDSVQVNDGTVPEMDADTHVRTVRIAQEQ